MKDNTGLNSILSLKYLLGTQGTFVGLLSVQISNVVFMYVYVCEYDREAGSGSGAIGLLPSDPVRSASPRQQLPASLSFIRRGNLV